MKDELTYAERYEIPLKLVVKEFHCEYYECGSHQMALEVKMDLEHLKELVDSLKKVKGLEGVV